MRHGRNCEVLVVGAGPVGMTIALLLQRAGIDVRIIDEAERTAVRSYSCGIHPRSLALFRELGLEEPIHKAGHRIDSLVFYDGASKKCEIDLSQMPGDFPYVLALPQAALEDILEDQLRLAGKLRVQWNHRLSDLKSSREKAFGTIAKLQTGSTGIIYAEVHQIVAGEMEVPADFIVGADGPESFVRQSLGIACETFDSGEMFTLCDFESAAEFGNEAQILLEEHSTEMLWPISDHLARWSIQSGSPGSEIELPDKERIPAISAQTDDRKLELEERIRTCAPWFAQSVKEIDWLAEMPFQKRVVRTFGKDRCWLAGDSAHQTSPLGMQSMNLGLTEASQLAECLIQVLRRGASIDLLEKYNQKHCDEWRALLDPSERLGFNDRADEWIRARSARIISCLPATGSELAWIGEQLGLELKPGPRPVAARPSVPFAPFVPFAGTP